MYIFNPLSTDPFSLAKGKLLSYKDEKELCTVPLVPVPINVQ